MNLGEGRAVICAEIHSMGHEDILWYMFTRYIIMVTNVGDFWQKVTLLSKCNSLLDLYLSPMPFTCVKLCVKVTH